MDVRTFAALCLSFVLAGCVHDAATPPKLASVCQAEHIEPLPQGPVIVCDEVYPAVPHVRLPSAGRGWAYAAVVGDKFLTMEGTPYGGVDLGQERTRHASAVYELRLRGTTVQSYRPAVLFNETLFLGSFLAQAMEGTISRRIGPGSYEREPSVPVRLQFAAHALADEAGSLSVHATVSNLRDPVMGADGTCLRSIASYGAEAAFDPSGRVSLEGRRSPSMHAFGDDAFTMTWSVDGEPGGALMSHSWFLSPMDIVQGLVPTGSYSGAGHGTPGTIPVLDVRFVTGGGQPCVPP